MQDDKNSSETSWGAEPVDAPMSDAHIEWTASEYLAHQKGASWYGALALAVLLLVLVVYFVTGDIISTVVIGVVGILFGVFAARQPRVLNYSIDSSGVHVGEKLYPFGTFKSFSVGNDQAMSYISLTPLRRFMPPLTIHYAPEDEDVITNTLSQYLPFEEHKRDIVDSFSRKIRF